MYYIHIHNSNNSNNLLYTVCICIIAAAARPRSAEPARRKPPTGHPAANTKCETHMPAAALGHPHRQWVCVVLPSAPHLWLARPSCSCS